MPTAARRFAFICIFLTACAPRTPGKVAPAADTVTSLIASTGGPFRSAIFIERVDHGAILIDLGWTGARAAIQAGLKKMNYNEGDVVAVFLTHSHRDHIAGWKSVRHAPFYLAARELPLLLGEEEHGGWIPRYADRLRETDHPDRGDITARTFSTDTAFVFGSDTLRAFLVPGHTAGSTVYLFRTRLYAGDAIAKIYFGPYVAALPGYSDDRDVAKRSLESLRRRLAPYTVTAMCTSHLACREVNDDFWRELTGS
jgi:glyoxylase-like metal-dependent hydrolase (beta-lactamase superfamily II)